MVEKQHTAKRVCMFVYNNFTNDSRVLKEAKTLTSNGYEVTVIAYLDSNTLPNEVIDGVKVIRVKRSLFLKKTISKIIRRSVVSGVSIVENKIEENNTINTSINRYTKSTRQKIRQVLSKIYRPLIFKSFYKRCLKIVKENSFDIYHSHDLNTLYLGYKAAKKTTGKLLYDSHELYVDRNKIIPSSKLYKKMVMTYERFLIRKADKVITVGKYIAQVLSDRYKIDMPTVIMNAPNYKVVEKGNPKYDLKKNIGIKGDDFIVLYTGSITFNRGLEHLIESMKYVPKAHLVFMGYGEESFKNNLLSQVNANNLNDRFSFFGPVPSDEVSNYVSSADVGVAPIENACLSYYYCAPNKLFEYMIGGISIVASDFPEMKSVIEDHKIGYTFDITNPRSIADKINSILSNDEIRHEFEKNIIKASVLYNWENESKKLLNLYQEL